MARTETPAVAGPGGLQTTLRPEPTPGGAGSQHSTEPGTEPGGEAGLVAGEAADSAQEPPGAVELPVTADGWAAQLAVVTPSADSASLLEMMERDQLSQAGRIDTLRALERHAAWITALQVGILADVEARTESGEPDPENPFAGEWDFACEEVACALRLSGYTAAQRLETARALDTFLPTTVELLERGEICYIQAKVIADAADTLDPRAIGELEAIMAPKMPRQAVGQTRKAVARAVIKADPGGAERRHRKRRADRDIWHQDAGDGMATWGVFLPAEQAARMDAAVDRHAATLADDGRTLAQKRVDALYDLVVGRPGLTAPAGGRTAGALRPGPEGTAGAAGPADDTAGREPAATAAAGAVTGGAAAGGRSAALVQVTVSLDTLIGADDNPADLKGYGPITAGRAREIAFAPGTIWRRLITEPKTGRLVKTDPTAYKPTAETERHVIARDARCTFPSCQMPAHRCDIDHVRPFNHHDPAAGGQTVPDNLTPLCRRHHLLKHRAGWTVERLPDTGALRWTAPTGHVYINPPHSYTE